MLTLEEIRQLSKDELVKEIAKAEQELLKAKLLIHAGQSKETSQIKQLRKTIARIKTLHKELSTKAN